MAYLDRQQSSRQDVISLSPGPYCFLREPVYYRMYLAHSMKEGPSAFEGQATISTRIIDLNYHLYRKPRAAYFANITGPLNT